MQHKCRMVLTCVLPRQWRLRVSVNARLQTLQTAARALCRPSRPLYSLRSAARKQFCATDMMMGSLVLERACAHRWARCWRLTTATPWPTSARRPAELHFLDGVQRCAERIQPCRCKSLRQPPAHDRICQAYSSGSSSLTCASSKVYTDDVAALVHNLTLLLLHGTGDPGLNRTLALST